MARDHKVCISGHVLYGECCIDHLHHRGRSRGVAQLGCLEDNPPRLLCSCQVQDLVSTVEALLNLLFIPFLGGECVSSASLLSEVLV